MKVCLASRPENAISAKLKLFPSLRLQDLNAEDIDRFVRGKLSTAEASLSEDLVYELIHRAEGVFLWAALVVKSMISGALAGDSVETLKLRLDTTPKELNDLFKQLLLNVDKFHQQSLSTALYHLGMSENSRINTSIGLITASSLGFNTSTSIQDFLEELPKTADRLVAQCQGLVEVHDRRRYRSDESAWIFDFRLEKPTNIDGQQWKFCYDYHIQLVHRSAHDFLFDHSDFGEDHDLEKQVESTLDGLAWLMQHGPTNSSWRLEACYVVWSSFDAADRLGPAYKSKHYSWLDKLHANLSLWFPPERMEVRDSINDNSVFNYPSEPWNVISQVWSETFRQSQEYAESRWNLLMKHPKASSICSEVFKTACSIARYDYGGARVPDFLYQTMNVLRGSRTRQAATWIAHTMEVNMTLEPYIMSWDTQGGANESDLVKNLRLGLKVTSYGVRFSAFWELLQEFQLFVGTQSFVYRSVSKPLSETKRIPLQMQVSVYSAQQRVATQVVYPPYYRVVCLMEKTPRVGRLDGIDMFKRCDEDVVGIYEPSCETITRLIMQDTLSEENECFGDQVFPRFAGLQADFDACLERILEEVWANENDKLGAWQQLYMLACVKKWFKNFWTIMETDPKSDRNE